VLGSRKPCETSLTCPIPAYRGIRASVDVNYVEYEVEERELYRSGPTPTPHPPASIKPGLCALVTTNFGRYSFYELRCVVTIREEPTWRALVVTARAVTRRYTHATP